MDEGSSDESVGGPSFSGGCRDQGSPVLVVDDDPDIRDTLREVIEAEGYPVVCAADGEKALEALARGLRPSLVVLDLMMPRLSGWDVLAAIRADRVLADVPVAVISAAGGRAAPPGATWFLQKPIDLDTLLALVADPRARLPRRRDRLPPASGMICPSPREDGLATLPRV